jgi:hypothetical protein
MLIHNARFVLILSAGQHRTSAFAASRCARMSATASRTVSFHALANTPNDVAVPPHPRIADLPTFEITFDGRLSAGRN